MRVSDVMSREVVKVAPDATLEDAARMMRDASVGSLPVCEGDDLVGLITDRDITVRATAEGLDPTTTHVRQAMTPRVYTCFADEALEDAMDKMEAETVRRLVVLDRTGVVVGMLSLDDLQALPPETEALERTEPRAEPGNNGMSSRSVFGRWTPRGKG